jgi:ribosomal-protein-alanine N-acetyltransferase
MNLTTRRTQLIVAPLAFVRAVIADDRVTAAALVEATLPEDWPGSSEATEGLAVHAAALDEDPRELPWRIRLIITQQRVVGSINLKGPPDVHGDVEIGWGLVADARMRGLATEAAHAVIQWARAQPGVTRIIATIPPDHDRSQAVARRLGMQPTYEIRRDLPVWTI